MRLSQTSTVVASLFVMILHSCESSHYSQLTIVDLTIKKFFNDEEHIWNDINSSTSSQVSNNTLTKTLSYFDGNLHVLGVGSIEAVRAINEELANYIDQIRRTQYSETRWLDEKKYDEALQHCETIISTIPGEISQIFDVTKSPPFMAYLRDNSDFCQTNQRIVSPNVEDLALQNVVMDFYVTVAEALVKGYMTSQMAFMVQGVKGTPQKYHKKSLELRHSFTSQYRTLETNVRSIIQNFTGEIWNCDDFTKEYSYTEITNFIQGYIDNEVNFNREDTCSRQCSDFHHVDYHVCRNNTLCILNYLDKNKTRCDGEIRNCEFIESDMRVCPNENDQIPNRRYHYVRYYSGLLLGRPQFCPYELKVKSWTRWFYHCSYCFCYCDHANSKYTDRYFSLREATSNIAENKVVTGIRFLKKNRIIHIFISERKLGPNGKIEAGKSDDEPWLSDYNFVKEDSGVKEGVDYHELSWKNRIIEIDTIRAPKDEVVTGVRLRVVSDRRLRFEIRTTQFDRETGYLSRDNVKSVWRANNFHDKEKIPIGEADVPIFSPVQSKRVRTTNKYIEFTPTDMYKDIAQTTVPFIDTQPVEAKVLKPLVGAGLYYKTTPGYGGFIGPLIILHDD